MKKAAFFALLLLTCASIFITGDSSTKVSAQDVNQNIRDRELAQTIKRVTDRSIKDLVIEKSPKGGFFIDLGGKFQSLMLSKLDAQGEPEAACVTSLEEANAFLGKNLETGEPVISDAYTKDKDMSAAAAHGMSQSEFNFYTQIIQEAVQQRAENPNAAAFNIINADGAGEGFNDPAVVTPEGNNLGVTRGQQRMNVFNFAASIWGAYLDTNVPINVKAQFDPLTPCSSGGGVLGSAGAGGGYRDFNNAQFPNTWYHAALANKQAGTDLAPNTPEINATFNSSVDAGCLGAGTRFYYGLDNVTPSGRVNLLVVLLHELGHGLGFSSFVDSNSGALANGMTDAYSRNIFDRSINKYWYQMSDAERQSSALNTGNVFWDGKNVNVASGYLTFGRDPSNGRIELFTPNPLQSGSSVSHWSTSASPNLLMEPSITAGLPIDLDLTRQQMRDIGWFRDTNADLVPDTIANVQVAGNFLSIGSNAVVSWTNAGGFDRNVAIELSTDGGATYPVTIAANAVNIGSYSFVVPNIPTAQARIRIREYNFAAPSGFSTVNLTISNNTVPCAYSINPPTINIGPEASSGTVSVTTGSGCAWSAVSNNEWIALNTGASGNGGGAVTYSISANSGAARTGTITIAGNTFIVNQFSGSVSFANSTAFDFDGDGKADISVYRPSTGEWHLFNSQSGYSAAQFGSSSDKIVAADYDGDGRFDLAVYRGGTWYIQRSQAGFTGFAFGLPDDVPVPADYDGDGKGDAAVFRPSNGTWYINRSSLGFTGMQFGISTDKPVVGDYDGDGKADIAVYRPSNGTWYIQRSQSGFTGAQFGEAADKVVPADYDGDGKTDIAVYRPSNGTWYLLNSSNNQFVGAQFGLATDLPVPADYDGDRKVDIAVFRNGTWYINRSQAGFTGASFGTAADKPVANSFIK